MALVTCPTTIVISVPPDTHLHLSEVKHLKVLNIDRAYHNVPAWRGRKMICLSENYSHVFDWPIGVLVMIIFSEPFKTFLVILLLHAKIVAKTQHRPI